MPWNEPGGNQKDPWNNKDQGPPDLDEVVKNMQKKLKSVFGGDGDQPPASRPNRILGWVIVLILLVIAGINSFYIVQPAERGVEQRFGAFHQVTEPGPHLLIPFIDKVTIINVDQINKFGHRAQMLTKDENIVDISLTVQYRIQKADDFLFQDADPVETIYNAVESALREVIGKSTLNEVITENRSAIATMIKQGTQRLLDNYQTGLVVTKVNIQDATPPAEVKDAFDDATKAMADKERVQNQAEAYANDIVPRARGAAARQIENAKAYKAKVISEAKGETQRFLALLKEYQKAPEVTRTRLYLDTLQEVLAKTGKVIIDVPSGNMNLTYLPLDQMIGNSLKNKPEELPGYDSLEATSKAEREANEKESAIKDEQPYRSRDPELERSRLRRFQ